jgi:Tfp pilus assembly protein PilF
MSVSIFQRILFPMNFTAKLVIITILSLAATACQTSGASDREAKLEQILNSRKDIIRNALNTGQPHVAMKDLRHLLKKYPTEVELNSLMGLAQLGLKNEGRAARYFRIAYKMEPTVPHALNLSSAYIESGDSLRAIKLLKSLLNKKKLAKYTYQERIYHNIGYAFFKMKRYSTSEKWLKKALVENPGYFLTHLQLARLYQNTKRPALARREYRSAIDFCHVCYEPIYALSQSLVKLGRSNEAKITLKSFTRVEGINPKDKIRAQKMLRWISGRAVTPTKVSRRSKQRRSSKG